MKFFLQDFFELWYFKWIIIDTCNKGREMGRIRGRAVPAKQAPGTWLSYARAKLPEQRSMLEADRGDSSFKETLNKSVRNESRYCKHLN